MMCEFLIAVFILTPALITINFVAYIVQMNIYFGMSSMVFM